MELYYNPEQMDESEIKRTFVARQWLLDDVLSLLKRQPKGAGVQHGVIIGPRGMGKTTMLLMLRFAVKEGDLSRRWFPVRFPEESYGVTGLADFWLATISNLAYESSDFDLAAKTDELTKEFKDEAALCDGAVATLKDWSKRRKLRILLLVDNLDMVLDQIHNSADNARLRDVLMNDGTFMLVGTATSFFKEARNYDQALYNFFRTWNLDSLDATQLHELLRQRAAVDNQPDFEERIKQNRARIEVLHYFTGGNPRLILMLYRIIATSEFIEVRRGLEKLLDEVTPYYKAKIEILPPQQRKILDHVARISGRTGEGLTPTRIAQETRLPVNQVSTQLKRLSDLGYVRAANVRTRNSYYSLAEPLYAIWHQMRFGRESRQRMEWLIEFLKSWYTNREMVEETEHLAEKFRELLTQGMSDAALKTVEYRRYLSAAIDPEYRGAALEGIISDCLAAGDASQIRTTIEGIDLEILKPETIQRLHREKLITPDHQQFLLERNQVLNSQIDRATAFASSKNWNEVLSVLDCLKERCNSTPKLWALRAMVLHALQRNQEALECFDQYLRVEQDDDAALRRVVVLLHLHQNHLALDCCDVLIRKDPNKPLIHFVRAVCFAVTGRFDEADHSIKQAILGNVEGAERVAQTLTYLREQWQQPWSRFAVLLITGATNDARVLWDQLLIAPENRAPMAAMAANLMMYPEHARFLRTLVPNAGPDSEFFCVSRALDYVLTGDRSVIERLSAEVRPAVEEIVRRYEGHQTGAADPPRHP
jgi:tetratricopeptide (TPR) repeat protein